MLHVLCLSIALAAWFTAACWRVRGLEADREGGGGAIDLWPDLPALQIDAGVSGPLPESVTAVPGSKSGEWIVTFSLASDVEAASCSIAGSFNHWNADAAPMVRTGDGRWRVDVTLPSGAYRYKFCLGGTRWIPDPGNPDREDDGFESHNSLLRLGAVGRAEEIAAGPRDGAIQTSILEHDPAKPLYLHRPSDRVLLVRYRTLAGDVERVDVAFRGGPSLRMEAIHSPAPFQFWQVEVDVRSFDATQPTEYAFAIVDGDAHASDPRTHRLDLHALPVIRIPVWAQEAIWYQIFPERFANGDPANDPSPKRSWTSAWYEPSEFEGTDGQTFWQYYVYQRMYGGDLKGIEQRLDHLVELGVTAIYLNPVFHAPGPHKYNATDFRHIDTGFGAGEDYLATTAGEDVLDPSTWTWTPSDRVFLDFLKTCKGRGFRVVIDAVFNHVGVHHPAFRDVQQHGELSRFADWFIVRSWEPFEYAGWAGFGELPVFAKSPSGFASNAVKEHIFAVTRRWMDPDEDGDPSDGIDGWRLDVPMELPREFWAEWRALVKSINPDAYISGEIWDRADEWLDGAHFDAVMNYRFAEPVLAWVGNRDRKIPVSEFDRRLLEIRLAYPEAIGRALMNLVDSHDTDRVASMLLNPDRPYDRSNQIQQNPDYNTGRPDPAHFQRVRLIALLQATYVGAPMIYYGDEVGMWGADDPTNRQPMIWKDLGPYDDEAVHFDDGQFEHYQRVIELRRRYTALRMGDFRTVLTDDAQDLFVFERSLDGSRVLVALNASEGDASFELPADASTWTRAFGEAAPGEDSGTVTVPPISGRVWHAGVEAAPRG